MDAVRQCLGTNSITMGFSKAIRLSNAATLERQAGRDDVVADGSKGAGHGVEGP